MTEEKKLEITEAHLDFLAGTKITDACEDIYTFYCKNRCSKVSTIFNGIRITFEDDRLYRIINKDKLK